MSEKIKVLVVDDSIVSQRFYRHVIGGDNRFDLVHVAGNGLEAIEAVVRHRPDVVSMDINMPLMDGIKATRQIMETNPLPILVVSSLYHPSEQEMAVEVLGAGAVAIMAKPHGPSHPRHSYEVRYYLSMLKSMSEVKVVRRRPKYGVKDSSYHTNQAQSRLSADRPVNSLPAVNRDDFRVVVIGASAGGPEAIKNMLSELTPAFPVPILIVQHIDSHFSEAYRLWLSSCSRIPILLCGHEESLVSGCAYLAPGDKHMIIKEPGIANLSNAPAERGHRPSVGQLFRSAGLVYKKQVIAVMLSGMGSDGALEMKYLKDMGALTYAQNETSCLVYGMPGEAVKLGCVDFLMHPTDIAKHIVNIFKPTT